MARLMVLAALVAWLAGPLRRRPARVALLRSGVAPGRPGFLETAGKATEVVGSLLRRCVRRPADPPADRRVGVLALAAGLVAVVEPLVAVAVVVSVPAVRRLRSHATRARRRRHLAASLPDTMDLLRLGAEAGLSVAEAIDACVEHGGGPIVEELAAVRALNTRGARLADALERLRPEPALVGLVDALIDSERYGAPLVRTLERLALDARGQRRRQAEQEIRKLPVRMLLPLVLCVLPALGVLAVVPIVVVTLDGFSL